MSVPTTITALSTTPASNSPSGSETPAEGDDHIRQMYAFLASIYSNSGNGWTSPYLPLAGGLVTGSIGYTRSVSATTTPWLTANVPYDNPIIRYTLEQVVSWETTVDSTGGLRLRRSDGLNAFRTSIEGYQTFYSRVGINGKTPVAAVTAPAVPTDLASCITAITAIRTALINFGIFA